MTVNIMDLMRFPRWQARIQNIAWQHRQIGLTRDLDIEAAQAKAYDDLVEEFLQQCAEMNGVNLLTEPVPRLDKTVEELKVVFPFTFFITLPTGKVYYENERILDAILEASKIEPFSQWTWRVIRQLDEKRPREPYEPGFSGILMAFSEENDAIRVKMHL